MFFQAIKLLLGAFFTTLNSKTTLKLLLGFKQIML